tara:strand:- start:9689 stop:11647 length:1959 start_codon:yes stop_codon:yes gene_type:complete
MNRIRVGAAALNQTPLDWVGNRNRIVQAIGQAREQGVSLLCFPELSITGYGCEDAFLSIDVADRAWDVLESLQQETVGMAVVIGLPVFLRGGLFNAAAMLVDGELKGLVAKQNLAGDGLHYEPRWFKAWPEGKLGKTERGGYLIGDQLFEIGNSKTGKVRVGLEICEDAWVTDPPGIKLAREGLDIILNPSASHFAFGKQDTRKGFILDNSRAFSCGYVYANLMGNEAGRSIYDGGCILASGGRLLAEGPRLKFGEVHVTSAVFDLHQIRTLQARVVSRDIDPETHRDLPAVAFDWPEVAPELPEAMPTGPMSKESEFSRAVSLGLFDYLRKSHSRGFVVSLSGGADSGAVACLVHLMLSLAREELGDAEVKSRLGDWLGKKVEDWPSNLLTCVYQATRNSGEVTRTAAREVASALGAGFHEWDIEELVEGYSARIAESIGRELTWEKDDIALQNIQARVRSPGIWMLTNIKGALLLSTSNRSEAAVGYATMDGDTSGGLSPIAGIDKAFLRNWLRWLETEGGPDIEPIPALKFINDQQPTAELRPQASKQTDEDDLMPYPVLNAIECAAIRDKKMPKAVFELMCVQFPKHDEPLLKGWVKRFFTLWSRNQWKRERYAPSFHLDDANLDPKTWCRFPILSGGFEEELKELDG